MLKLYPSDLSDKEWKKLETNLPKKKDRGRPREVSLRSICNAIFYIIRTGCQWRYLPADYPPWQTVYYYFKSWRDTGLLIQLNDTYRKQLRHDSGRNVEPSAAIIDSQSVKTTEVGGVKGYDAGKKIKGRKRHIIVDVLGFLIGVVVHAADLQDRDGAKLILCKISKTCLSLKLIWADGGYRGALVQFVAKTYNFILEIVKRDQKTNKFKVLPRRWVVERTFAWISRYRRLSKDYERMLTSSEAFVYLAMIRLMIRRVALQRI